MTTPPICGILIHSLPSGANPKPSAPMTAPECRIARLPMRQPW